MAKKQDGRVGYEFEDKLKSVFGEIKKKRPFDFHRFLDTKAAGRVVAAQLADYMISFKDDKSCNHVIIVEAKASEENESLRSCASGHILPQQIGKHKSWLRSGGSGLFLFYCEMTGEVEVWDSKDIVEARSAGKPLDTKKRLAVMDYLDLENELINFLHVGVKHA